jgi:hypothetical protein
MAKKHSIRNRNRNRNSKSKNVSSSAFKEYRNWLTQRMEGGAYSVNVESQIAGQPVYDAYADKYAPAIIDGKLVVGAAGSGCGAMVKGGSRKTKKHSRRNHRNHRSGATARKHTKAARRHHSARKSRADLRRNKHHGGSMPAPYPEAHNGETSNFIDDMTKRDLGCSQPSWGPTCA